MGLSTLNEIAYDMSLPSLTPFSSALTDCPLLRPLVDGPERFQISARTESLTLPNGSAL